MATFKDVEDQLKTFIIQEQSDAHNIKSVNVNRYNNIKVWMDATRMKKDLLSNGLADMV